MRSAALSLLVLVLVPALAGCGEKGEPPITEPASGTPATGGGRPEKPAEAAGENGSEAGSPAARAAARRRAAERVVRAYLEALNARDGARVCHLLAPGALEQVDLPRERGSCAASLDASIGYRDPRGLPQFEGIRLAQLASTQAGRRSARVTATVVTDFADREEPSIEDDIVYLERESGEWLIAKPDAALYRAIGAEPSARSIIPPG